MTIQSGDMNGGTNDDMVGLCSSHLFHKHWSHPSNKNACCVYHIHHYLSLSLTSMTYQCINLPSLGVHIYIRRVNQQHRIIVIKRELFHFHIQTEIKLTYLEYYNKS